MKLLTLYNITLALLPALVACSKTDYLDTNARDRAPLSASIRFVNARPVNVPLQFWTFTTQVTNSAVGINEASPYLPATFGNVQINFTEGSSTSYKASRQFGNQATFSANGGPNGPIAGYYHTVFAAQSSTQSGKDTLILFYDNLENPPAAKVRLRFVHLAPGLPDLSLRLESPERDTLLFASVKYGSAGGAVLSGEGLNVWSLGPFSTVDTGTVTLKVSRAVGQQPVDLQGGSTVHLSAGKIYTVFLNGIPDNKSATGAYTIIHN